MIGSHNAVSHITIDVSLTYAAIASSLVRDDFLSSISHHIAINSTIIKKHVSHSQDKLL